MPGVWRNIGLGLVFVLAAFTTILVSRYLTFDPDVYFDQQRQTYIDHRIGISSHIIGGMIAMALGPFQFIAGLRQRWLTIHRWIGRVYLSACAVGGIAGLYMAYFAHGGFPAALGFGMLAGAWLTCAAMALIRIRARNIAAHREWVVRSYALTFAAVTLRIYLAVHGVLLENQVIDLPFTDMYIAVAWICWVPNLIAAECYIGFTRSRPKMPASALQPTG